MNWDTLTSVIENNRWEQLKRNPATNYRYQYFKANVLKKYASLKDYMLENKISKTHSMCLLPNDFPYDVQNCISHCIAWHVSGEAPSLADYKSFVDKIFDPANFDVLIWINPEHIQSVPDLSHCHVFVKSKFEDYI